MLTKHKRVSKQKTDQDYENLGKLITSIHDSGYLDHRQAYKVSFLKGLASGAGGIIGATIVVALLIWVLSLFHNVPLIGHFTNKLQNTVQSSKKI